MSQYTQSVQQELHSGSHSVTTRYAATQSDTTYIAAPGYHKSIFLCDLIISCGDTAGYVEFAEDTGVTQSIISRQYLAINGALVSNFSQAIQVAPNAALNLSSTTADDFTVTSSYYIDDVVGFGYTSGGKDSDYSNIIDENYFSSDFNSTDVGNLTVARNGPAGQSSAVSGYTSGGYTDSYSDVIDKFSFSSGGDATDVGNLTVARRGMAGQSSAVSGYTSGGYTGSNSNVIDKFSFNSDGDATDVGNLTAARRYSAGQSSAVSGYTSAGYTGTNSNVIDKFSFSSDGDATDVGDLTVARFSVAGQQGN